MGPIAHHYNWYVVKCPEEDRYGYRKQYYSNYVYHWSPVLSRLDSMLIFSDPLKLMQEMPGFGVKSIELFLCR